MQWRLKQPLYFCRQTHKIIILDLHNCAIIAIEMIYFTFYLQHQFQFMFMFDCFIGEALLESHTVIDFVYCSPSLRCVQTAYNILRGERAPLSFIFHCPFINLMITDMYLLCAIRIISRHPISSPKTLSY